MIDTSHSYCTYMWDMQRRGRGTRLAPLLVQQRHQNVRYESHEGQTGGR